MKGPRWAKMDFIETKELKDTSLPSIALCGDTFDCEKVNTITREELVTRPEYEEFGTAAVDNKLLSRGVLVKFEKQR